MIKKASILMMSALSVVASCTMEETLIQEEQNNQSYGKEITIRATREDDPETRTVLESDGSVWWTPGDAISLFYGSGTDGGSKFTSNATENSKITNFTGVITAITGGGEISVEETYFWGIYPYRNDVSCDGSSVTMTLPSQQTAVSGTFAPNLFPSMGRSQGLIMGFYNVCGGWRFSVTKEGINKVILKSNNCEPITGKVKVGFDASGIPVVREIIDGSDEIVLESPEGEYFETGKNYYMILLPTTFSAGFTMTFETDSEVGVYDRTASTTVKRSKFSGITDIDNYLTTPYTLKSNIVPIEDANFKAYLVENFDEDGDGEISLDEAGNISYLFVGELNIRSLQGIEYMPALEYLECYDNQLTSLDVSHNTALTGLHCFNNQLTNLDVSNNTALRNLVCNSNQLHSLNVSNNIHLQELQCNENNISRLDISNNTALTILSCSQIISEHTYHNQLRVLYVHQGQLDSISESDVPEETVIRLRPTISESSDYVDLGLPSGVKWANFDISDNMNCSGYYAWGEVAEKERYYWEDTYEWGGGGMPPEGSGTYILKYNTKSVYGNVDNKMTLYLEDDVAHDILGGNWRMPTYDEFVELIENCDWEQTSATVFTATSKINGNSIQFSLKSGNYGMDSTSYEDGIARYWSSSLDVNNPTEAWRLTIRSNGQIEEGMEMVDMVSDIRSAGLAIRPVYDE